MKNFSLFLLLLSLAAPAQESGHKDIELEKSLKSSWKIVPVQLDEALGATLSKYQDLTTSPYPNPRVQELANIMVRPLLESIPDNPYTFRFRVINNPEVNAFALPGGHVYINSGLLAQVGSEAQLIGVIGHEIGHVILRHATRAIVKEYGLAVAWSIASAALSGKNSRRSDDGLVRNALLSLAALKMSRDAETDADNFGARLCFDSGFDPREFASFFKSIPSLPGWATWLSTHPDSDERELKINTLSTALVRESGVPKGHASAAFAELKSYFR